MQKKWIVWILLGVSMAFNLILIGGVFRYLSPRGGMAFLFGRAQVMENFYAPNRPRAESLALLASLPKVEHGIVFIGDDAIANGPWDELFPEARIARRGLSGETSHGVVQRIGEILPQKPSAIFIMVGFNDILRDVHPNTIGSNFRRMFDAIDQQSPSTRVYVMSILPYAGAIRPSEALRRQLIIDTNSKLADISAERGATYIDLYSAFANEKDQLKPDLAASWRLLGAEGYQRWHDMIDEHVQKNIVPVPASPSRDHDGDS